MMFIFPSFENNFKFSEKYFYILIIPAKQFFIIFCCIYVTIKGGSPTAFRKDIEKYGVEKINHFFRQFWLSSILVPGSGQLLLGHTKRGIFIFLIFILEVSSILVLKVMGEFNYLIPFLIIITFGFWVWNIMDACSRIRTIQ